MDMQKITDFFKSTWYVLLIIAIAMFANYNMVKDFQQLPSPIYGGDIWNHLGTMYHIVYGGSFFDSGQLLGEIPWVPRVYHIYQLLISYIFNWDQMVANIYNSIFLIPVTAYLSWFLVKRFTNNTLILAASVILALVVYPFFKYTLFAYHVMIPILFIAWYLYLDKPDMKRLILLSVVMGISALTNTQLFFVIYILLGVVALDKAHKLFIVEKKKVEITPEIINTFKPFLFIFLISFVVSLIYWYWPLFVYKVHTPNDLQIYGWVDFSKTDLQISYPFQKLFLTFTGVNPLDKYGHFEFMPLIQGFLRIAVILGGVLLLFKKDRTPIYLLVYLILIFAYFYVIDTALSSTKADVTSVLKTTVNVLKSMMMFAGTILVIQKRNEPKYRFAFFILAATLIALFHHLLTYNLVGIQLAPERLFEMYFWTFGVMLFAIAGEDALIRLKGAAKYVPHILAIFVVLLFVWNYMHWMKPPDRSFEDIAKKNPVASEYRQLQSWILNNTGVYDVFLTTNEDAFMMNGFTGRKSVSYRRTHTSTYADLDQRNLDSAVMLYTTNDKVRTSLLKKYNVSYLLWTSNWVNNQIVVNEKGQIVRMFDPFMAKDKLDRRSYLEKNNVSYVKLHYYMDPAFLHHYPTYDIIVVPPQGKSGLNPWSEGMHSRLTEVYKINFTGGGANYPPFAVIYEVRR